MYIRWGYGVDCYAHYRNKWRGLVNAVMNLVHKMQEIY